MEKRIRFIILIICFVLFFIAAPLIILYSFGYRVNFEEGKIVATGGIYARVLPAGADIIVDSEIKNKAGLFSNSVFVQNLSPDNHEVLIRKEGYHDYKKSLLVKENEVTKLENVILFKQNIAFDELDNDADYFSMAPDNNTLFAAKIEKDKIVIKLINVANKQKEYLLLVLPSIKAVTLNLRWSDDSSKAILTVKDSYFLLETNLLKPKITARPSLSGAKDFSFDPQNPNKLFFIKGKDLYLENQVLPILRNVLTYNLSNQTISWLSQDGFLYATDDLGQTKNKLIYKNFPIKKNSEYKIKTFSEEIFLKENQSLFLLNKETKTLEKFYDGVENFKISPDGQKLFYFNNNEILYSILGSAEPKVLLYKSDGIEDCHWLNNDYIIFSDNQNNIIISEIDARGNLNAINLPSLILTPGGKNIAIKNPQIFFNQLDKKLYLSTQSSILVSERLIP